MEHYPATINDTATGSANADTVVTYAAQEHIKHVIDQIICSYASDPTNGRVRVEVGGNVIFDVHVTSKGPAPIPLVPGIEGGKNEAVVVTLSAGGSGIIGKLNVRRRTIWSA